MAATFRPIEPQNEKKLAAAKKKEGAFLPILISMTGAAAEAIFLFIQAPLWITVWLKGYFAAIHNWILFNVVDGVIRVAVDNRYLFTDLAEVGIEWRLGSQRGTALARVPARSRGVVEIRPADPPGPGEVQEVTFTDPRGFVCEREALTVGPRAPAPAGRPSAPGVSFEEAGGAFDITSGMVVWRVDRATGGVSARTTRGEPLIVGGPEP